MPEAARAVILAGLRRHGGLGGDLSEPMAIVQDCLASDAEADEMLVDVLADFVGPIDQVVVSANIADMLHPIAVCCRV